MCDSVIGGCQNHRYIALLTLNIKEMIHLYEGNMKKTMALGMCFCIYLTVLILLKHVDLG